MESHAPVLPRIGPGQVNSRPLPLSINDPYEDDREMTEQDVSQPLYGGKGSPYSYGSIGDVAHSNQVMAGERTDMEFSQERAKTASIAGIGQPSLAFVDVSYIIPPGLLSRKKEKVILNSLSGLMLPGLNAIMGPTGSGKTTLLDILADRKSSSRVGGKVYYNCERIRQNFRFNTGYVVQDDIVTGTLTVRENFHFSAALRLPSHMSSHQRRERVEKIINELGLNDCADRKIGTEFIRGVSGGERKRTNIGMELIIEPQVLFLDEPTTGLDAHTAVSVIKLLKNLTKDGSRIVIMSIHQPRYSIFKLFDTLTLLSLGNLVYHGQGRASLDYFRELGFECEEHDNPADFFLDVIDTCEQQNTAKASRALSSEEEQPLKQHTDLGMCYQESESYHATQKTLQPLINDVDLSSDGTSAVVPTYCFSPYATNVVWQSLIVAKRSALKMWRNPMTNILQIAVMVIFALITGGIFFRRPDTPRGMQDRLGAIFFIVMSQVFGNMGAIELFIKEKVSFLHETSSGYYRVSVYFIAKVITDLLILRTLPLSLFCVITYFMIGFQIDVAKFFFFYLALCLTTVSGAAIAFAFSAMVNVFAVANLLVSLVFILYMIFGGFLIGLSSLPSWIQWMKYVSVFRYAIEAIAVSELKNQNYSEPLKVINGTVDRTGCLFQVVFEEDGSAYCFAEGNQVLSFQGYHEDWGWYDQVALFANCAIWLSLTYTILRIAKVYYRYYK